MAVRLIYETHSTTVDNERGIATGWLPGELSAVGRRQAAALGARYPDGAVDVVYVSDLARAVQTVDIAFNGRPVPIVQDRRLRECDYGDWTGMTAQRLAGERSRRIAVAFPNGQSYRDVVVATAQFLMDLARDQDGATVLMVAHAANRYALTCLLGRIPLAQAVNAPFVWQAGWRYLIPAGWAWSRPAGWS